jgi:hypothetical protein
MECYVNKKKPLKEYEFEYKKNMFQLHEHYKTTLKTSGKRVNMEVVIEFMNQQSLSSQLFVLKKFEETCSDNQEVTMTPKKQVLPDEVVECPGAPLKESK